MELQIDGFAGSIGAMYPCLKKMMKRYGFVIFGTDMPVCLRSGIHEITFRRCKKIPRPVRDRGKMVPVTGLEPVRCRQRWILSPLRLPFHHTGIYQGTISQSPGKCKNKISEQGREARVS